MQAEHVRDFLVRFERDHWKGRSKDAWRGYRNSVTRFAVYLRREPKFSDLRSEVMAEFDRWLQTQVAKKTRKSTMGKLRTLWRAAYKDRLVDGLPPEVSQSQCGLLRLARVGAKVRFVEPVTDSELNSVRDPGQAPVSLREFVPRYAAERGIRPRTIESIRHRLTCFETWLGRPATLADLNDTVMNLWTAKLFDAGLSAVTIKGYRGMALALWRAAYELNFVNDRPGRIRKIKIKPTAPQCWTQSQLAQVVQAVRGLHGELASDATVRRAAFWTAFVLVAYYSALRPGDLLSLQWDQIQDGLIVLPMSKTGDIIVCALPPDALEQLEKIRGGNRVLVFGQLMNDKNSYLFFRRVLRSKGLPGSIKWFRRTSATLLERVHPGAAKAHLGHRTHGLAYKHYVDPRLLQQDKPLPPSISQLMAA
jgi:integrase